MPDTAIVPSHPMTTTEVIIYALTAGGSMVVGVLTSVLRFGSRIKALEADAEARKAHGVDNSKTREEWESYRRDMNASLAAAKADHAHIRSVVDAAIAPALQSAVAAAVAVATTPLRDQITELKAQHASTLAELNRVRDAADRAEAEGARRWESAARELGGITHALKGS